MEKSDVARWIEGYIQAWNSNDPQDIGQLFTEQAAYYTGPWEQPWQNRRGIVDGWLERKDDPGSFNFRYEVLAADGDTGVVRGWTEYPGSGRTYSNIWVIRFDEGGQATEFTEWFMRKK